MKQVIQHQHAKTKRKTDGCLMYYLFVLKKITLIRLILKCRKDSELLVTEQNELLIKIIGNKDE